MEDCNRSINPWVLHLQKLGLELKCPLCLKFLSKPLLLPCDHIFCDSCVPRSSNLDSECPVCKSHYRNSGLRSLTCMEGIINIYRNLDSAFAANLLKLQASREGVHKNSPTNGSTSGKDGRMLTHAGVDDTSDQNLHVQPPSSQESNPQPCHLKGQEEINHMEQLAPSSPPSESTREDKPPSLDSDKFDHSPDSCTRQLEKSPVGGAKRVCNSLLSETPENQLRDSKRQKQLMYPTAEIKQTDHCNIPSVNQLNGSSILSGLNSESKPITVNSSSQQPATSDDGFRNRTICGFCQSSRVSEATGEMLHYLKGRPVEGDDVFHSNVIHVHSSCIEWAPQVYYEGDTVNNLKPELARGSKIKCTKCGLKGAALGCYVKTCRRSYHVPCAREIPKCRWDYDDFLLLCPVHSSARFPKEKSKPRIVKDQPSSGQITSEQQSSTQNLPNETRKWVLCGSALSPEEKLLMVKFASKIGAAVSKFWRQEVTHVIAATDEHGACMRTLKVLMGTLNGKWILKTDWIKASMESNHPVEEESFEVCLDNHGCHDGPRAGRLRALHNGPKLFQGLNFYFLGEFVRGYKEDLENLVEVAGGKVLKSTRDEVTKEKEAAGTTMVVYNMDPPRGCELGEEVATIWQRLSQAQDLAAQLGTDSKVVGHTWLLASIAAYQLQPLVS